jgi:RNase P subunit RPR2
VNWQKLYATLQPRLRPKSTTDLLTVLQELQEWLRESLTRIDAGLRTRYGLDDLVALDLAKYPIESTNCELRDELAQLEAVQPTSMETLMMRVRDAFWRGITRTAECQCPRCDSATLRVLVEEKSGHLVMECETCGWVQDTAGGAWQGSERLVPPTTDQLNKL